MPTIFSRIIAGELPGRFVWRDDRAVAFSTIHPLKPGHTLVVPRQEVDHWIDLAPELASHLFAVAQAIGRAMARAFRPARVGLMIAGLEVPHTHLHVIPIDTMSDLDPANQDMNPKPNDLDDAAKRLRGALRALGYPQVSD